MKCDICLRPGAEMLHRRVADHGDLHPGVPRHGESDASASWDLYCQGFGHQESVFAEGSDFVALARGSTGGGTPSGSSMRCFISL